MTNTEDFKKDPIKFYEEMFGVKMPPWQEKALRKIASVERHLVVIPKQHGFNVLNEMWKKFVERQLSEGGKMEYTEVTFNKVIKLTIQAVLFEFEGRNQWVPKICIDEVHVLSEGDIDVTLDIVENFAVTNELV